MRKLGAVALIAASGWLCIFTVSSRAADFTLVRPTVRNDFDDRKSCNLRMSGAIIQGDLANLKQAAAPLPQSSETGAFTLCLNSPGGSYDEGLRIASYLMDRGVVTLLQPNAQCYSACALIFMAGGFTFEGAHVPLRMLHFSAQLGFHAPYLRGVPEQQYNAQTIEQTYAAAIKGIRELANLGKSHRLTTEIIPTAVFSELLSKGPNELFLIDTVFKVVHSRVSLVGVSIPRAVSIQMLTNACTNHHVAGTPDLDNPPTPHSSGVTRKGNQVWLSGFGGEGAGYCVLKVPGDVGLFSIYPDVVLRNRQSIDQLGFTSPGEWYLYSPRTPISSLQ